MLRRGGRRVDIKRGRCRLIGLIADGTRLHAQMPLLAGWMAWLAWLGELGGPDRTPPTTSVQLAQIIHLCLTPSFLLSGSSLTTRHSAIFRYLRVKAARPTVRCGSPQVALAVPRLTIGHDVLDVHLGLHPHPTADLDYDGVVPPPPSPSFGVVQGALLQLASRVPHVPRAPHPPVLDPRYPRVGRRRSSCFGGPERA